MVLGGIQLVSLFSNIIAEPTLLCGIEDGHCQEAFRHHCFFYVPCHAGIDINVTVEFPWIHSLQCKETLNIMLGLSGH